MSPQLAGPLRASVLRSRRRGEHAATLEEDGQLPRASRAGCSQPSCARSPGEHAGRSQVPQRPAPLQQPSAGREIQRFRLLAHAVPAARSYASRSPSSCAPDGKSAEAMPHRPHARADGVAPLQTAAAATTLAAGGVCGNGCHVLCTQPATCQRPSLSSDETRHRKDREQTMCKKYFRNCE